MMHRRQLLVGTSGVLLAGLCFPRDGQAQAPAQPRPAQATAALEARARRLGIPTPVGDAARIANRSAQDQDAYGELLPRLVDIIVRADQAGGPAADVAEAAAELLARIHRAERSLAPELLRKAPSFESVRQEYRELFDQCQIADRYKSKVDQHVDTLKAYKSRYESVGTKLGIPWYFIGIIHALEAGFNFRTHLHNGDSLTARTVQVPKGRPAVWNPPTDWEASAQDALRIKNFDGQKDWSLEQTLYRWELYNGFGYRSKKGADGKPVYSPYLWSFSNQYSKGKYVRDGVWDPSYVSQQCGACTMLRRLVETNELTPL
jgi:lysozyme family protein